MALRIRAHLAGALDFSFDMRSSIEIYMRVLWGVF